MSNKICLNTNIIILIILLFGFLLYLYNEQVNKKTKYKLINTCKKEKVKYIPLHNPIHNNVHTPLHNPIHNIRDPVKIKDNIDIKSPFVYPEERLDRHNLYLKDKMLDHKLAYIHTQGYPDTPKLRGYLYENTNDTHKRRILPLFGYETYPNSYRYKYYTILNDVGLSIHLAPKIEIEYIMKNSSLIKLNKRELYDNDIVQLNDLETSQFTIKLLERNEDINIY